MSKQYRAAIVGCGSIGQAHMQGYQRIDNIEVVAVADPLEPARNMYMSEYGIPEGYATVAEMLEKARPDIVRCRTSKQQGPSRHRQMSDKESWLRGARNQTLFGCASASQTKP